MKRDMDLVRRILLDVEQCPDTTGNGYLQLDINGYSQEQIVGAS
jgi:hypothetical protein